MSYDLRVAPRHAGGQLPSVSSVGAAIRRAGGRDRGDGLRFFLADSSSGEATLDIFVTPEGVASIEVSTPYSIDPPSDVYNVCAAVASDLSWDVYDPQGGVWLAPQEMETAISRSPGLARHLPPLDTLLGGAAFFTAMLLWLFKGASFKSPWFVLVVITGAALSVAHLHDLRRGVGMRR